MYAIAIVVDFLLIRPEKKTVEVTEMKAE